MKKTILLLSTFAVAASLFAGSYELTNARLYRKQNEPIKALKYYDEEILKVPGDLEAQFERAELLGEIAMDSTKRDIALQITTDKSNPTRELLQKMVTGFADAQKAKAADDEKTVKKLKKKIDRILAEVWDVYYFKAVHDDSAYVKASEGGGKGLESNAMLESALKHLDIAIMLIPEKWNAHGLKAQILNKLDRMQESTDEWKLALKYIELSEMSKKDSENYQKAVGVIRENLLQNYYTLKQFDKTIEKADEILAKEPQDFFAIQLRAFALAEMASDTNLNQMQRNAYKLQAIKALNEAKTTRPDDAAIVYYIGQFHLQLGDTASSIAAFNDYLKIDSTDATVIFNLGVLYLEGGSFVNTEKARDTFKKLTHFHPDNAPAWINYGVALIRLGKNEEGRAAVEKGKALSGK
jgi:Flp pilus assembly protein TadD